MDKKNYKSEYSAKLRDPRWQRLRLEVMQRDNFSCQGCGDTESTLNVHHFEYHGNPWETPPNLLITLCEQCHEQEGLERKEAEKKLLTAIRSKRFQHHSVNEIAEAFSKLQVMMAPEVTASIITYIFSDKEIMRGLLDVFFESLKPKK